MKILLFCSPLVSTLSKLTEQGQVNAVAQTLYSSGILKEGK